MQFDISASSYEMEEDKNDSSSQLTNVEAAVLLALMQDAVDSVPSYVETRAIESWIENSLEQ